MRNYLPGRRDSLKSECKSLKIPVLFVPVIYFFAGTEPGRNWDSSIRYSRADVANLCIAACRRLHRPRFDGRGRTRGAGTGRTKFVYTAAPYRCAPSRSAGSVGSAIERNSVYSAIKKMGHQAPCYPHSESNERYQGSAILHSREVVDGCHRTQAEAEVSCLSPKEELGT